MTNKCRREFEEWVKREKISFGGAYLKGQHFGTFQAAYDKRTKDAEVLVEFVNMCASDTYDRVSGGIRDAAKQALAKWEAHE